MPYAIPAALFALAIGALVVPAGAQLIGRLIEIAGLTVQAHGEALHDAYVGYVRRWRQM